MARGSCRSLFHWLWPSYCFVGPTVLGTEWRLCWLPLGGYVKLHGQERLDDRRSGRFGQRGRPGRTFHDKSGFIARHCCCCGARLPISCLPRPCCSARCSTAFRVNPRDPVIQTVRRPGSAAARRPGSLTGDRIVSIHKQQQDQTTFEDIVRIVSASAGQAFARNGRSRSGVDSDSSTCHAGSLGGRRRWWQDWA